MVTSLSNSKCLNSVLKLWLPLMWLPKPQDFKWLWNQFHTFLMIYIFHTTSESMKLDIQEVNLWLPLLKSTENVVTIFGNQFFVAWYKFLNPKSISCV